MEEPVQPVPTQELSQSTADNEAAQKRIQTIRNTQNFLWLGVNGFIKIFREIMSMIVKR